MIFNERLRRLRKERGLTQAQTAEHLSIAWRNYQRLEKDGNAPSFLTFVKAAEFFGVSLDYLAGRTDAREVNRGTCPPAGPEHRIILEAEVEAPDTVEPLLRRVISAALEAEGMDLPCEINVLLTDDEGIHQVNLDMRGVDRPTDVLSFPMFDLSPGEKPGEEHEDPDTGLVPLGDMCISLERAAAQAEEYGHSVERELSYLAVHSVLHLLGYDHMDEGPMKAQMRRREEHILEGLGIRRG
ncbi:rRNA maturation RNase YbeY [Clostridium phoceensis]|uniref:rRNA maturation RNase YbeY n=1 Tax=Clostridium phoceensis TaxID=1650661 RepID=UPI003C6C1F54